MSDTVTDVPTARARLHFYSSVNHPHYYWRIDRCPHCGSPNHEYDGKNVTTEAKARELLGRPVRAECHHPRRPRYYIVVEAEAATEATGAAPTADGAPGPSGAPEATGMATTVQDGATGTAPVSAGAGGPDRPEGRSRIDGRGWMGRLVRSIPEASDRPAADQSGVES